VPMEARNTHSLLRMQVLPPVDPVSHLEMSFALVVRMSVSYVCSSSGVPMLPHEGLGTFCTLRTSFPSGVLKMKIYPSSC